MLSAIMYMVTGISFIGVLILGAGRQQIDRTDPAAVAKDRETRKKIFLLLAAAITCLAVAMVSGT